MRNEWPNGKYLMARRPAARRPVVTGTRISADWRASVPSWPISAMLANIRPEDYEATARAFETHHRGAGTVSDDWMREWKQWCRDVLVGRRERAGHFEAPVEVASISLFD